MTAKSAILGLAFLTALATLPAHAATYGIAIGIDDYIGRANDLAGAVNDAEDIAAALRAAGALEVVLLTDGAATKAAIEAAWMRIVALAGPGDTIVFSYAGHGSQEPEPPGRGGEADGLNETFLLGGYQSIGARSAERIVDDEIFAWLQMAEERGIEVIFVADSCHSGTMYRSLAGPPPTYRVADFDPPVDPGEGLPEARYAMLAETDFAHVTFIGATQEHLLTPEIDIDGVRRGALSWAFARAIEGAADRDGDGALTQHELLAYLVPTVEIKAQQQQTPSILPLSPVEKPVLRIGAERPVAEPPAVIALAVAVRGDALLPEVAGVVPATTEAEADLIWDVTAGWVEHRIGGRVAENVGPADIADVLAKWAALAFLESLAVLEPFPVQLAEGNGTHVRGEEVTVRLGGGTRPYLTLFNLPPDGSMQLLFPINAREAGDDWTNRRDELLLRVADPPFGAEHLVAILTDERPAALQAALSAMEEAGDATGLAALLMALLVPGEAQIGILGIYTAAE